MKMVGKVTMIVLCKIDIPAEVPTQTIFYNLKIQKLPLH